ncbi:coiled-coil domain-containing protein 50-like [Trichosurus vulpecula]|uniref:coiled-coil domain-containing protein 50-like n=1 Tax=Trichosurus vulpecula TaxID=9337 RepID=UPI00186B10F6|nr:coiled-coil domain-containing protein 50-like [Trichosurus vulpecula]
MSGLHVDRARLPGVQEVCQDFAILEDGALAHCLQKQEIEQHYASNVQKSQLVQMDIRIARKLQDVENQGSKLGKSHQQKKMEESDSELARSIQEEIHRKAEECRQREEDDQEIAKKLQELEEEASSLPSSHSTRDVAVPHNDGTDPINWQMAELDLQSQEQLQQDEELAWRLQEEEETHIRTRRNRERNDDYRTAQVAQDEEIARYMQDEELKYHQREVREWELRRESRNRSISFSEQRQNGSKIQVPPDSEVLPLARDPPPECSDFPVQGSEGLSTKQLFSRNIAEELDPTFKSSGIDPPVDASAVASQALTHTVPVEGLFEYNEESPEAAFISPTKRQSGRQKTKDKKEACKQQ